MVRCCRSCCPRNTANNPTARTRLKIFSPKLSKNAARKNAVKSAKVRELFTAIPRHCCPRRARQRCTYLAWSAGYAARSDLGEPIWAGALALDSAARVRVAMQQWYRALHAIVAVAALRSLGCAAVAEAARCLPDETA